MSTDLTLSVALAAHANAYCHNFLPAAELAALTDWPPFRYVTTLHFSEQPWRPPSEAVRGRNGEEQPQPPAEAIRGWLDSLRRHHTERLQLDFTVTSTNLPPAYAAAFANANPTAIVISGGNPHMLLPKWLSSDRDGWRVVYYPFAFPSPPPDVTVDVAAASDTLRRQLAEARAFAVAQGQAHWDKYLSKASAILVESDHHSDLLPTVGYSAAAHRLVTAASAAWVFGGMGSWNDMGITDRAAGQRYREITDAFFAAVVDGYLVAANSFEPPAGV